MKNNYLNLVLLLIISIFITLGCSAPNQSPKETAQNVNSAANSVVANVEKITEIKLSYDIVETWQIPNGGSGKRILIPKNLRDEKGLFLVCDKISEDVKNDKHAIVFGHTDSKSAGIQKNLSKSTKSDQDYLGKNFILDFKKNGNNGFHECVVYPNGIDDLEAKKVKKY
jgi:hypothetical protein